MMKRTGVLASGLVVAAWLGAACSLMKPSHEELMGGGDKPADASVGNDAADAASEQVTGDADAAPGDADAGPKTDATDATPEADAMPEADVQVEADGPVDAQEEEAEPLVECEAGAKACADACVPLDNPLLGCGAAGCSPCALANADAGCDDAACSLIACNDGWTDCDGLADNGCEADVNSDPLHCGGCNAPCTTLPNMTASCVGGSCSAPVCMTGYQDCNLNLADGCEIQVAADPANCGVCGNACVAPANATATCSALQCGFACLSGFQDCNGNSGDGCEQNLQASTTNCGACGNVCSFPNAQPSCNGGVCEVGSCIGAWGNCNGQAADGCETDTQTSVGNCGTCGAACNGGNGTPSCIGGACSLTCDAGYANCDGSLTNGCEVNTGVDLGNCGGCGLACLVPNATPACAGGACQIGACNAGWGNCNNNPADGCELPLTSLSNCGTCGTLCSLPHATETCATGSCQIGTCDAGWGNCDSLTSTGCETDLLITKAHCGTCGHACSGPNKCINGTCQ